MRKTIYIESDEEITSIIDKLKKADSKDLAIVAPKGSLLLQSLVNLRLLKRQAEKSKAQIDVITTDPVGTNLATQAGLSVFKSLKDSRPVESAKEPPKEEVLHANQDTEVKPNFAVNYYKDKEDEQVEHSEPEAAESNEADKDAEADQVKEEAAFSSKKIDTDEVSEDDAQDEDDIQDEDKSESDDEEVKEASGFVSRSAGALHSKASFESKNKKPVEPKSDNLKESKFQEADTRSTPIASKGGSFTKVSAQKHKKRAIYTAIIGVLTVIILAAAYLLIPRASINILVKQVEYDQKNSALVTTDAEKEAPEDSIIITGKQLKQSGEASAEFSATGKREVGEKASGEATIYNSEDTLTHTYPAGTRFTTMGKVFVSTRAVTVPGATVVSGAIRPGTVKVELEATVVGEDYNVGPAKFVISGAPAKIFAESTDAFGGGSSRQLTIVSQTDLTDAQSVVADQLINKLVEQLQSENADINIHKEAVTLDGVDFSSSDNVGSETDKFTMTVSALATVIAYDQERLLTQAQEKAENDLSAQERIELDEQLTVINFSSINEAGDLLLEAHLVGHIVPKYDEKELARTIRGKNDQVTMDTITQLSESVERVDINRFPKFWRFNPLLPSNINFKIDFE